MKITEQLKKKLRSSIESGVDTWKDNDGIYNTPYALNEVLEDLRKYNPPKSIDREALKVMDAIVQYMKNKYAGDTSDSAWLTSDWANDIEDMVNAYKKKIKLKS